MPFERSFSAGILTPIVTAAPEVHDAVPSDAHDAATGAVSAKGQADEERRKAVKAALMHSWEGYKKYAWGTDELKPQARSGHNWLGQGGTIIDAMSTLAIMGEPEEFKKAAAWVKSELHFGCVPHARPVPAPGTPRGPECPAALTSQWAPRPVSLLQPRATCPFSRRPSVCSADCSPRTRRRAGCLKAATRAYSTRRGSAGTGC